MTDGPVPLVRRGRRNARYTSISNDIIDHPALSPEARIVLIYLLSKPDNWQLRIGDIRRLLGTGYKACGRNKAYEVIKELKTCVYVIAVDELQQGRFYRLTYFVFDEPHPDPEGFRQAIRDGVDYDKIQQDECRTSPEIPSDLPDPQNRETVNRPHPRKPYPENRHLRKEQKKQKTEVPPPSPNPTHRDAGDGEGPNFGFSSLWDEWPETERPNQRSYAEGLFARLTPDERRNAIQFARAFRSVRAGQGGFAPMIYYIRDRLFLEFDGAPEIDHEGYFVIKPGCDEWTVWLNHYRSRCSEKVIASMEERGFLLTRTRWPTENVPANGSRHGGAAIRPLISAPKDSPKSSSRQRHRTARPQVSARGAR
jgi:hypothetical protein